MGGFSGIFWNGGVRHLHVYQDKLTAIMSTSSSKVIVKVHTSPQHGFRNCLPFNRGYLESRGLYNWLRTISQAFLEFRRSCREEEKEDTVKHFLCNCPALAKIRASFWGRYFLNSLTELSGVGTGLILRLIRAKNGLMRKNKWDSRASQWHHNAQCKV